MRTHRKDAGFSLAALIFFATAASILMAAAIPVYRMQAKREMEEELIFRGEEYMRAIRKYHTKFGAYPTSVDQLISTNNLRFLRKSYKDPMTDKEFRLITMNPDGSLTGSKMFTQNMNTQPLFANPQTAGQGNFQQQGARGAQQGQQTGLQMQTGQQGARGFQSAGQQLQQGQQQFQFQGQQGQQGQQGTRGQQLQQAQQRGQQFGGVMSGINSSVGTPVAFAGIIGVASDSELDSIKVYNTRQKYDEWEFIAVMNQQAAQGQQPNQQQGNQNPNQQPFGAQRMPFGSQPNSPFQNSPTNPIGGPPQTSPFGPAGGQRQNQNPFGFGGTPQQQPPRGR